MVGKSPVKYFVICMLAGVLLQCCNSSHTDRPNSVAKETAAKPNIMSSLAYADIDPFISIENMSVSDVRELFAKMNRVDQQYRDSIYGGGDKERRAYYDLKSAANDEANLKILDSIVKKHGWPRISVFGKDAAETAWLIVWHHRGKRSILCRYFDLMEKAVSEKEMNAISFQQIKERVDALSPDQIDY